MSLYLPYVDIRSLPRVDGSGNLTEFEQSAKAFIAEQFRYLDYGDIECVDLVRTKNRHNISYYMAFVHFKTWYETPQSYALQEVIYERAEKPVVWYTAERYWIVGENRNPRDTTVKVPYQEQIDDMKRQLSHLNTLVETLMMASHTEAATTHAQHTQAHVTEPYGPPPTNCMVRQITTTTMPTIDELGPPPEFPPRLERQNAYYPPDDEVFDEETGELIEKPLPDYRPTMVRQVTDMMVIK